MDSVDNLVARRFRRIVEKARDLNHWQQRLDPLLDPSLRPHVKVANVEGDTVVLQVNSASWATRLRFNIPQLLAGLKQTTEGIHKIKCIVRPDEQDLRPKKRHIKRSMPETASDLIRSSANTIKDPELRRALEKLSER